MTRRRKRSRRGFPVGAFVVLLLLVVAAAAYALWLEERPASPPPPPVASGLLRVHYVDVGQGDAAVWEMPDGSLVVYDCGDVAPSPDGNPLVRHLRDRLGRAPGSEIHALVASHGHRDHVGGCDEVFETYRVRHVYEAWYEGPDRPRSYERFLDLAKAEGAQLHTLRPAGEAEGERTLARWDAMELPAGANASAVLLWPEAPASAWDRVAEHGLAYRLAFGEVAFCFQGDVETAQEARLASEDPRRDLSCDVYLVGHHGSREASSDAWLRRMDPRVALVSFGENAYGHPTPEALCRVQASGAKVYATHRLGTVTVETDGRDVRVTPDRPETIDYCASGASYWPE